MTLGVIGIGRPIRGDDGIGVVLIDRLQNKELPEDVNLLDAGTSGMNLLHHLKDFDRVIIIDAIRHGGDPGDWLFFSPEEVNSSIKMRSTHDSNLLETLELSEMLGEKPDKVVIMGIIPADMSIGEELSPSLNRKLPEIENVLLDKIEELID